MTTKQVAAIEPKTKASQPEANKICCWLGLQCATWPPDHYTLLGIDRQMVDLCRLEDRVQERIRLVRRYQLSDPVLATEALNQLARAFACLTNPEFRRFYDASLPAVDAPAQSQAETKEGIFRGKNADDTVTDRLPTVLEWQKVAPPPVRQSGEQSELTPPPVRTTAPSAASAPPVRQSITPAKPVPKAQPGLPLIPMAKPVDPFITSAQCSKTAQQGLCTRADLYLRIKTTRKLLSGWKLVQKCLGDPEFVPSTPKDVLEMRKGLARIDKHLPKFPPLIGVPGKPGYRVAALAADESPANAFRKMELLERESLALDWRISNILLEAHLAFLREEIKRRKQRPKTVRAANVALRFFNEHQLWFVLGALGLLGLALLILAFVLTR